MTVFTAEREPISDVKKKQKKTEYGSAWRKDVVNQCLEFELHRRHWSRFSYDIIVLSPRKVPESKAMSLVGRLGFSHRKYIYHSL